MTILAAVDETPGTNHIIDVGVSLATAYSEPLDVLHVIPEDEARAHFESLRSIAEFRDISIAREDERASDIAEAMIESSNDIPEPLDVRPRGKVGNPIETILEQADELDARYVVVGGRRRSPAGKAIFGSVTQEVLLSASVPVVTVLRDE